MISILEWPYRQHSLFGVSFDGQHAPDLGVSFLVSPLGRLRTEGSSRGKIDRTVGKLVLCSHLQLFIRQATTSTLQMRGCSPSSPHSMQEQLKITAPTSTNASSVQTSASRTLLYAALRRETNLPIATDTKCKPQSQQDL